MFSSALATATPISEEGMGYGATGHGSELLLMAKLKNFKKVLQFSSFC
jgi:hypothetical protein